MIVISLSCSKDDIIEKIQNTSNHLGAKVIPDDLGTNGWGGKWGIVLLMSKKKIEIMEKMTRND